MRTRTLFISYERLAAADSGVAVATLGLVCNDLAIANSSMARYNKLRSGTLAHIRRGGRMYFSRMMCGHLNEAMEALEQIRADSGLMQLVHQCSSVARQAFANLCKCLRGGSEHRRFNRYVGWVRHRVAFHYQPNDLKWAMEDRGNRAITGTLTAGWDIHTTRFEFGDDLIDSIVVRKLWKISRSKDLRQEADRIGDWCNTKCLEFLQFSQEFVPSFLRNCGAVR